MTVKLLTEHLLEFLSLKGGCTGSSESTLVKMPHCWKSHVAAQISILEITVCLHSANLVIKITYGDHRDGLSRTHDRFCNGIAIGNIRGYVHVINIFCIGVNIFLGQARILIDLQEKTDLRSVGTKKSGHFQSFF